jgi:hypothetical protein
MNAADSVCVPGWSTAPAGGSKVNVPGTEDVGSSCAGPSGVPNATCAGCGHVSTGVPFTIANVCWTCGAGG